MVITISRTSSPMPRRPGERLGAPPAILSRHSRPQGWLRQRDATTDAVLRVVRETPKGAAACSRPLGF